MQQSTAATQRPSPLSCSAALLSAACRGYLQYLSGAPVTEVPYPEEPITLQLLSITMSIVFSQIQAALRPGVEAYLTATYGGLPDEATVAGVVGQQALSQWINCGALMVSCLRRPQA